MTGWQQAHEVIRTDWNEVDPRHLTRYDAEATIPCGLMADRNYRRRGTSVGDPCPEMFFTEDGQVLHHWESHGIPLPLRMRGTYDAEAS